MEVRMSVPTYENDISLVQWQLVFSYKRASWGQTRLKLSKDGINMNVQVEECLSVSYCHHSRGQETRSLVQYLKIGLQQKRTWKPASDRNQPSSAPKGAQHIVWRDFQSSYKTCYVPSRRYRSWIVHVKRLIIRDTRSVITVQRAMPTIFAESSVDCSKVSIQ